MRFTEEDGIITAEEARKRSDIGTEDSIVREQIRNVMESVKTSSLYGYRKTRIIGHPMMEGLAAQHIQELGYTIKVKESVWQSDNKERKRYDWNISW